jgi:hypothetical protein
MSTPSDHETESTVARIVDRFTLAPMRDALVDLSGLPAGDRVIVWLGYALFLALLAASALFDLGGYGLLRVAYPAPGEVTRTISWAAIGVASAGFAAGWAYVLLAATRISRLVALLAPGVLAAQLFFIRAWQASANLERLPAIVAGCVAAAGLAYVLWRRHGPALGLVLLAALVAGLAALHWLTGDASVRAAQAHSSLGLIYFASLPIWLAAGLALLTLGSALAAGVVARLRDTFAPGTLRLLFAIVIFGHPFLIVLTFCPTYILVFSEGEPAQILGLIMFVDMLCSLLVALLGLALLATRRWGLRQASVLIAVRLTLVVFVLGLLVADVSGFNLADPLAATIERVGALPPGLFFMFSLILSVLGFFMPFANGDGARIKRRARVPLAIGAALLCTSTLFFFLNAKDVATGEDLATGVALTTPFLVGAVALGFPYLAYVALRAQDALVGPADRWQFAEPRPEPLPARASRRMLLVALAVLPLVVLMCGCVGAMAATAALGVRQ